MLQRLPARDAVAELPARDGMRPDAGDDIRLSNTDRLVLEAHYEFPLASINEVEPVVKLRKQADGGGNEQADGGGNEQADGGGNEQHGGGNEQADGGGKEHAVRRAVTKLKNAGLMESDQIDFQGKNRIARGHLTQRGLRALGIASPTWHKPGNLAKLLKRLPALRGFYRLVGEVSGLGTFRRFHWLEESGLDAIAVFEQGWIGLVWSGTLESPVHLYDRLAGLADWLKDHATTDQAPWPARICFVAQDQFQKEVVSVALTQLAWPDAFTGVWCLDDVNWPGQHLVLESRGEVRCQVPNGSTGGRSWRTRVNQSIYTLNDLQMRILELIVEWRGLTVPLLKTGLGENRGTNGIALAIKVLTQKNLIYTDKIRRKRVHFATKVAYGAFADRDSVPNPTPGGGSETDAEKLRRLYRHEMGVKSFVMDLMAKSILVAQGDRGWEDMGEEGGGIAPDAIVCLRSSPYEPGWSYLEYELSARGESRVSMKLNGYGSELRRNKFPLLAVCFNDGAESIFHKEGARRGIKMLTTTVVRLADYGPLGNNGCWSMYGLPLTEEVN